MWSHLGLLLQLKSCWASPYFECSAGTASATFSQMLRPLSPQATSSSNTFSVSSCSSIRLSNMISVESVVQNVQSKPVKTSHRQGTNTWHRQHHHQCSHTHLLDPATAAAKHWVSSRPRGRVRGAWLLDHREEIKICCTKASVTAVTLDAAVQCVWNCAEWCAVSRYALGVVAEHFANIMIASAASCEQTLWRSHITLNTEDLLRLGIQKAVGRPWTIYDNLMFLYQGQVGPRDSQLVCQSTLLWGIQQLLLGFEQTSTWPMAQSSRSKGMRVESLESPLESEEKVKKV